MWGWVEGLQTDMAATHKADEEAMTEKRREEQEELRRQRWRMQRVEREESTLKRSTSQIKNIIFNKINLRLY